MIMSIRESFKSIGDLGEGFKEKTLSEASTVNTQSVETVNSQEKTKKVFKDKEEKSLLLSKMQANNIRAVYIPGTKDKKIGAFVVLKTGEASVEVLRVNKLFASGTF